METQPDTTPPDIFDLVPRPAKIAFTIREAAAATGLTVRQIEGAIIRGELRSRLVGRNRIIPASALRKLVGEVA